MFFKLSSNCSQQIYAVLFSVALVSCGGGGGDSTVPASTDTTLTDTTSTDTTITDTSAGSYFLAYSGSLNLVNAQDFNDVRLVTSAKLDDDEVVYDAAFNSISGIYEFTYPAYVVYIADGRIYKKSLTDANAPPVQISSATGLTSDCSLDVDIYLANIEQSPVSYTCANETGTYVLNLDTPASTSPRSITGTLTMELYDYADGSLGMIFFDAGNVILYDHRFTNPATIATGVSIFNDIYPIAGDERIYNIVQIDDNLHLISVDGVISPSVHRITDNYDISEWRADSSSLYFFEESIVSLPNHSQKGWRLGLDGSGIAVQFFEDPAANDRIDHIRLTTNKVILDRDQKLLAIDKYATLSSQVTQELVDYTGDMLTKWSTFENRSYYTVMSPSSTNSYVMDENGNMSATYPNSAWFGETWSWVESTSATTLNSPKAKMDYILLAENFSGNPYTEGYLNANLKSINLTDGSIVDMGTLTRPALLSYYSYSSTGLGVSYDISTLKTDVFAMDAKTGAFQFITDTPTISEWPLF